MNGNANKYMAKARILEFSNKWPIYKQICIKNYSFVSKKKKKNFQ